jgi:hypothetical protein
VDKDEKLRAISQLVFELTVAGSMTSDLDMLLERLFGMLCTYPELSLQPKGAIVLLNPRGRYFQVAQFGIAPTWKSDFRWDSGVFASPEVAHECSAQTIFFPSENLSTPINQGQKTLLLPLRIENQGIGYAVLLTDFAYQPSPLHLNSRTWQSAWPLFIVP